MFPNLETRWLHAPRWITPPLILVVSVAKDYEGKYWHPKPQEQCINGVFYDCSEGIIEITDTTDPSTLAHEFRHHWQWSIGDRSPSISLDLKLPYWERVIKYYQYPKERDALLFEQKVYPTDYSSEVIEKTLTKLRHTSRKPEERTNGQP